MTPATTGAEPFKTARLDRAKLRELARDRFGVTDTLDFQRRASRTRWGYAQSYVWTYSVIGLDSGHPTVESATRTLAHELKHIEQVRRLGFEEFAKQTASLVSMSMKDYDAYRAHPIEAEAIEAEWRWTELLPGIRVPHINV